jgi:hypothetical protein
MDVSNILQTTLGAESGLTPGLSFAQRINQRFKSLGGEALAVPERQEARPAPSFDASRHQTCSSEITLIKVHHANTR